jgi:hypothetical protein
VDEIHYDDGTTRPRGGCLDLGQPCPPPG